MMKLRIYLINILLLTLLIPAKSQEKKWDVTRRLEDSFYWILNSSSDNEKMRLNDSVTLIIDSYVRSDSVMKHRFNSVRNLGQIESPDKKIKIVNWNLVLRDGSNRYYLYIIRRGKKKESNQVFKLTAVNSSKQISPDLVYTPENWYGAAYYAIQPFKAGNHVSYLLLGIDFGSNLMTRKIIDVLNFDEKGAISFGKMCFHRNEKVKAREILEYSSEGLISLRLESGKLVVFDHLDPFSAGHGNSPEGFGAGLSFDGYVLKKGNWNFISDIDIKNRK